MLARSLTWQFGEFFKITKFKTRQLNLMYVVYDAAHSDNIK